MFCFVYKIKNNLTVNILSDSNSSYKKVEVRR